MEGPGLVRWSLLLILFAIAELAAAGGLCNAPGSTYTPQVMEGTVRTLAADWESCMGYASTVAGAGFFTFWALDGGCHLHPQDAVPVSAVGWGSDKTISGPVGCVMLLPPEVPQPIINPDRPTAPPSGPADKCPGQFNMQGYGNVAIVPTGWLGGTSTSKIGGIEVDASGKIIPHMEGRAYFADVCTGVYNHSQYLGLNLLGKKLTYMVDVSQATCGCNAAFYMTSMKQNKRESECRDYYCDANNVCGESCPEIDIMEANKHSFHATLHTTFDHGGKGVGYGGGEGWNGPRDFSQEQYGPGSRCVDTEFPFMVAVAFPIDDRGYMKGMFLELSQDGKDCPIRFQVDEYEGMEEMSQALSQGMTPIISYWEAEDMMWLDGDGADHMGPCPADTPKDCGDSVSMYDFRIESLGNIIIHDVPAVPEQPHDWGAAQPTASPSPQVPEATTTTTTIPCSITRKADCTYSQCCKDPGMQCYQKHQYWAACQLDCTPGVDPRDPPGHHSPWSCALLGERTPGDPIVTTTSETKALGDGGDEEEDQYDDGQHDDEQQPEVPELPCAATQFEDCRAAACCKDPGMQCYEKHKWWSACLYECTSSENDVWSCNEIGHRSPGHPIVTTTAGLFSDAVDAVVEESESTITATFTTTRPPCAITRKENCAASQCCKDPGMQCYEKDQYWSACELACTPGIDTRDDVLVQTPWTCKELGSRSPGDPIITTTSTTTCNGDCHRQRDEIVEPEPTPSPAPTEELGHEQQFNAEDQPWRCHEYLDGQDAEWCQVAGTFDGFQYKYYGPLRASPCDGCWCCKRQVEELSIDTLREVAAVSRCSITRKEDCRHTRCCYDPGMQCYEKNDYWAACELECKPGIDPRDFGDVRTPWTCKALGPRSAGEPLITTTTTTSTSPQPPMPAPVEEAIIGMPDSGTDESAVAGVKWEAPLPAPSPNPPAPDMQFSPAPAPVSSDEQAELEAIYETLKREQTEQDGTEYHTLGLFQQFPHLRWIGASSAGAATAATVFVAMIALSVSVAIVVSRRCLRPRYRELGAVDDQGLVEAEVDA